MTDPTSALPDAPRERPHSAPGDSDDDGGIKAVLHHYLQNARRDLRWKLEGLTERQLRTPLTPTGSNLLGILKHVSSVEVEYFTDCFDRPSGIEMPWLQDGSEPNADMFATAEESVASILELADRCAAASDAAIAELDLAAVGNVPWWTHGTVTLGRILVHMVEEYSRHLGQADILRELLDGSAGLSPGNSNLPGDRDGADAGWWARYNEQLHALAAAAPDTAPNT